VAYRETIDGIQFILLTATPEKELSKWGDLERFLRTGCYLKWTSSQPKENGQSEEEPGGRGGFSCIRIAVGTNLTGGECSSFS
jgi:hypothetical protein